MAEYVSFRLPTELVPAVEQHQKRTRRTTGVAPSFAAAAAALIRLGAEAAKRDDERAEARS